MPTKPVILVVDDERAILTILQTVLENHGMEVLTALSGPEAIAVCRLHSEIILALIDVCMPYCDGPTVFKALRQIHPGLRCYFATGMDDSHISEWVNMGVVSVFLKPFQFASLAESLFELATSQPEPSSVG